MSQLIFVGGGKPESSEKNPRSKDENQQSYDTGKASALITTPFPLNKNIITRGVTDIFSFSVCIIILPQANTKEKTSLYGQKMIKPELEARKLILAN